MILHTHDEQLKFLTKCYENIERLSESIITSSDKRMGNFEIGKSEELLFSGYILPDKIHYLSAENFSHRVTNLKTIKLSILMDLYNKTAELINNKKNSTNIAIDINEIFIQIKRDHANDFNQLRQRAYHPITGWTYMGDLISIEEGMQQHRGSKLNPFNFFFKAKSYSFLEEYGFFEPSNKVVSNINMKPR